MRSEAFNCFEQHFLLLREKSGRQITARTAADIAVKLTTGWFQPLYEQIDPMWLGETMRAMSIARAYGMRLAKGNAGNIDIDSLEEIISGYPQHGFVIDRDEAKELFKRVRQPTTEEGRLAQALIASGLIDEGLNKGQAVVRIISEEDCDFTQENVWQGIEYEETTSATKKTRSSSKRSRHRQNARKSDTEPISSPPGKYDPRTEESVARASGTARDRAGTVKGDRVSSSEDRV